MPSFFLLRYARHIAQKSTNSAGLRPFDSKNFRVIGSASFRGRPSREPGFRGPAATRKSFQMSQFEVIKDIGESMKVLFEENFKAAGFTTVNISVDKPKKDNIKNLP